MKAIKFCIGVTLCCFSINAIALPKFTVQTRLNNDQFTQMKITNDTLKELACYIAIDGFKRKFTLLPKDSTDWYTATDIRFKYSDFRTWCDFIEFYPEYLKYKRY